MKRVLIPLAMVWVAGCAESLNKFPIDAGAGVLCGTGTTQCGAACVNTSVDDANCGSCGKACGATEGCGGGRCLPKNCTGGNCATDQVCANSVACQQKACVSVACADNEQCSDGRCVTRDCGAVTCGAGFVCRAGACVDVTCAGVSCQGGREWAMFCADLPGHHLLGRAGLRGNDHLRRQELCRRQLPDGARMPRGGVRARVLRQHAVPDGPGLCVWNLR